MRVAYFTAGTTGAGHLVRGIALHRGLERAGWQGTYRMFGPSLPFTIAQRDDYEPVTVRDDKALRDPRRAPDSALARQLRRFRPDLLIVDLFWAPLRFVLPGLDAETWLLVRTVPDAWFVGPRFAPFRADLFDRIVAIEPIEHAVITHRVEPIVVANPDETRSLDALRQRYGIRDQRPIVALLHAGKRGEHGLLDRHLDLPHDPPHVLRLDLWDPDPLFPAAPWLTGADRVVTGAGYNAFWEARWLGYAARTHHLPLHRRIDDQYRRTTHFADVAPRANGADQLASWITGRCAD